MGQKYLSQKKFSVKIIFRSEKILGQKSVGSLIFWVKINFGPKKISGQKKFQVKKILVQNLIWVKKMVKKIWIRNFFCLKKQVGLNQGGGYMTPPQKIVGLKLCFIVVSFAW